MSSLDKQKQTPKNEGLKNQGLTQDSVQAERKGLKQAYNSKNKKARPGLKEKAFNWIKDVTRPTREQLFRPAGEFVASLFGSRNVTTQVRKYDDEAQDVEDSIRKIVDGGLDTYQGEEEDLFDSVQPQPRLRQVKAQRIDSPQQIEKSLDIAIRELSTYKNSIAETMNQLDNLDSEVEYLKKQLADLSPDTDEDKISELKSELAEKNAEKNQAYNSIEDTESIVMANITNAANGLKDKLNEKIPSKDGSIKPVNISIQDQFLIDQSLIPKFSSVGIVFNKNSQTREWEVDLPEEFGDLASLDTLKQVVNTTNVDLPKEKIEKEEKLTSSKFLLNDPRFAQAGKSRLENMSDILNDDYDVLSNHYDYPIESDLTEADLNNLKKRIAYTSEKLANWKPGLSRTHASKDLKPLQVTKEQIDLKFKAFDTFAKLSRYGLEYSKDKATGDYNVSFKDYVDPNESDGVLASEYFHTNDVQSSDVNISQFIAEKEKLEIETKAFAERTINLKQPQNQLDADILQDEIDRYLFKDTQPEMKLLLGSNLNGVFSYKSASDDEFNKNPNNKVKLILPYIAAGDTSLVAQAVNNIYNNLNIREIEKVSQENKSEEIDFDNGEYTYIKEDNSDQLKYDDIPLPNQSNPSSFYEHLNGANTTPLNSDDIPLPNSSGDFANYQHLQGFDNTPLDPNSIPLPPKSSAENLYSR
jgi:hypothetical protein